MIGRHSFFTGCCGLILLAALPARAETRLGPYTTSELEAVRGQYEPYLQGVFRGDLLGRLPPTMRAPLGEVQLIIPAEMPPGPGVDPAFVLNVGAVPAARKVYLPLRTAHWLDEYFGLVTHLEKRQCQDRLTILLMYDAMLTRSGGARPPGPLAAFGLDKRVYDDAYVKDLTNKLLGDTVFFLLAHELGHIAHGHAGGATGIHSQIQEREADAYAFDAMATVGAFPMGIAYFFTAAAMMEGGQTTHPLSGSRVDAAARALEARPRAFIDHSERNPDAWVPRLLALAAQVRQAIPLADNLQQRADMMQTAGRIDFAGLRTIHEKFCPP